MDSKKKTNKTLKTVLSNDENFECYPTTEEIIKTIQSDIRGKFGYKEKDVISSSVLDCGAGDGRVLNLLTQGKKYAIEKSLSLIKMMNRSDRTIR